MKIAYFSPLNPMKSGISDYSEALLPHLCKYADTDLWVDGYLPTNPEIIKNFKIIDYINSPSKKESLPYYDVILYQIGNNPYYHANMYEVFLAYPGVVVMHDFVLYYLVTGYYLDLKKDPNGFIEEMKYNYGDRGVAEAYRILNSDIPPLQNKKPHLFPLNKRLIEQAKGIIVHSDYAARRIEGIGHDVNIKKIGLIGTFKNNETNPGNCFKIRKKYGVENKDILIVSIGYVASTKRIDKAIEALNSLRNKYSFKYVLAGEGNYIVPLIEKLKMGSLIKITGYVPREELDRILACSDIVINLRYPSMGESSITLVDAMLAGKPCIVSDDAWFSELPNNCVIKIKVDDGEVNSIARAISNLIDDPIAAKCVGKNAKDYAIKEFNPDRIAQEYISFLENTTKSFSSEYAAEYLITKTSELLNDIGVEEKDEFIIDEVSKMLFDFVGNLKIGRLRL